MASNGVNKVILIGNVGRDPDVRFTQNGDPVANLALATSESWKDKNTGEKQERTEWHNIVFYGPLAEVIKNYVGKGSTLYVEGSLKTSSWEQDGVKRYKTEIHGKEMKMLGGGPERQQQPAQQDRNPDAGRPNVQHPGAEGRQQTRPVGRTQPSVPFDSFNDDIPF